MMLKSMIITIMIEIMMMMMMITIMIEIMMMMITIMINCIDTYLPKNLLKSFKDLFYAMTGYQYSNSAISVSRDKIDTWPVIVFRMLAPYGGYVDIEVFPTVTVFLLYLPIYLSIYLCVHVYVYGYIYLHVYMLYWSDRCISLSISFVLIICMCYFQYIHAFV